MKAHTHTEVYRRFEGTLLRFPLRPLVLAASGIRQGLKRRLPALLLYAPCGIGAVGFSVRVHLTYMIAEQNAPQGDLGAQLSAAAVQRVLGDAVDNILSALSFTSFFALLVITWFGAGLIAEDRRLGANLLYFSRPLTRSGYLLGKFLAAFGFGAVATVGPCLVICSVASFSSPEWSFLRQEWDAILGAIGFSALWAATVSVLVLAVSCLVRRKTHALVGVIGLVVLSAAVGEIVARLARDPRFGLFSLFGNFERLGRWMLKGTVDADLGIQSTLFALAALWTASLFVLASQVKKMEVVA